MAKRTILTVLLVAVLVLSILSGCSAPIIPREPVPEQNTTPKENTTVTKPITDVTPISPTPSPDTANFSKKIIIVEFSDFECPFCARAVETLQLVQDTYGDQVEVVFKQFPLSFHANAQKAAEASICARKQNRFVDYHDILFANQDALLVEDLKTYAKELNLNTSLFNKCLDEGLAKSAVQADVVEGTERGVTGTPTFFINGKLLVGAQPYDEFKRVIDAELAVDVVPENASSKFEQTIYPYKLVDARADREECHNKACIVSYRGEYHTSASSQVVFVMLSDVTVGSAEDIFAGIKNTTQGKISKETLGSNTVYRAEAHELFWFTDKEFPALIVTQEGTRTSNYDGNGYSYSYGKANGSNEVIKYYLKMYPSVTMD